MYDTGVWYVWYDAFDMYDTTHLNLRRQVVNDSFIYMIWLIHMRETMPCSAQGVMQLIYTCVMTDATYVQHV